MRAAAGGRVDFSKAELLNPRWHRRLRLILSELADEEFREVNRLHLLRHLTYLLVPGLRTEEIWMKHQEAASRILDDYADELLDQRKVSEVERKKTIAQTLRQAWANRFGSPDDPATQAKIDATAAALKAQRQQQGR